jgi:hypothetical protein
MKLSPPKTKYSTFDRELLASFAAVRHFRFVLEGRHFRILTDHLPLTLAMRRVLPLWSARQVRQLANVSEFSTDIRHTPGLCNVVADALSRPQPPPPTPQVAPVAVGSLVSTTSVRPPSPNDYAAMAAAQLTCTDCSKMCDSKSLFITSQLVQGVQLFGDVSTGVFRPLVPPAFRDAAVAALHSVAHPGIEATVRLVSSKFWWTGMRRYIWLYNQNCLSCQRSKVSPHVHLAPATIAIPRRRFEHIHVDIVGPLSQSRSTATVFRFLILVYCSRHT